MPITGEPSASTSPWELLAHLDSVLELYEGDRRDSAVKETLLKAGNATPNTDFNRVALMGSLLYGSSQHRILLAHCLLTNEPNALQLHNLLVAREMEKRVTVPGGDFLAEHMDKIVNLDRPLWPSEQAFDSLNKKLLGHVSVPIPAIALSNALLFADPSCDCLSGLEQVSKVWRDTIVLSTPFWVPRTGKLNRAVDLQDGISSLVAASIRFDPDRELNVAHDGTTDDAAKDLRTKAALATARRVRVLDSFPAESLPDLFTLMPSLTTVHLFDAKKLTASIATLASLKRLRELHVANCRDLTDLSLLGTVPSLQKLKLGGCSNLQDISVLAFMKSLQEVRLGGCSSKTDLSNLDALPSFRIRETYHGKGDPWAFDKETAPWDVPEELLGAFVDLLRSDNPDENLQGTRMIHKLLNNSAHTDTIIERDCLPLLVTQLVWDSFPALQCEAASMLADFIKRSKASLQCVLNEPEAVPNLVRLLGSPNEDCCCSASNAICNLGAEDAVSRDVCLDAGALEALIHLFNRRQYKCIWNKLINVRCAASALETFCKHEPQLGHNQITTLLPVLVEMLNHDDGVIVERGSSAISYLTDGVGTSRHTRVQHVLSTGCLPRIVELLGDLATCPRDIATTAAPAIQAICNIVESMEGQAESVIDAGALKAFRWLLTEKLDHPQTGEIREEVCFTLSNIAKASENQLQAVLDENLIPALMNTTKDMHGELKGEALFAINACLRHNVEHGCSHAQIKQMVQSGVVSCLCDHLADSNNAGRALRGILFILLAGEEMRRKNKLECNAFSDEVIDWGGKERIQELLNHTDPQARRYAKIALDMMRKTKH